MLLAFLSVNPDVMLNLVESSCPVFARLCTDAHVAFVDAEPVDRPTWLTKSASGRCPLPQVVDAAEMAKAVKMFDGTNKMLAFHMVWTNAEVTDPAALSGH